MKHKRNKVTLFQRDAKKNTRKVSGKFLILLACLVHTSFTLFRNILVTTDAIEFRPHPTHAAVAIVVLRGHITGGPQAVDLSAKLTKFIEQKGKHVVVDMASIDLINSSGLGMLVSTLTSMRKIGGTVKLADIPKSALHLLEITRLNTVFELCTTVEEAVERAAK